MYSSSGMFVLSLEGNPRRFCREISTQTVARGDGVKVRHKLFIELYSRSDPLLHTKGECHGLVFCVVHMNFTCHQR